VKGIEGASSVEGIGSPRDRRTRAPKLKAWIF